MFASLKRALTAHRNPEPGTVTGRKRIIAVLQQLKADHELLSVTVDGCRATASSAILDIDETRNCFLLDELTLPNVHRAFLTRRKALVQGHLNGMEVGFACHLLKAGSEAGIALYEAAIPTRLQSVQRRAHFRLPLVPELAVPVNIPRLEGNRVTGEASDLSAGGVGLLLRTRHVPGQGQILSGLSISLPESRPLSANIEVRFARLDSVHHVLRLGGRFVSLNREQERKLAVFLAEQQRKRRRFEPR